jgi:hypothetical protein
MERKRCSVETVLASFLVLESYCYCEYKLTGVSILPFHVLSLLFTPHLLEVRTHYVEVKSKNVCYIPIRRIILT